MELDFSDRFNTELPPQDELRFQEWAAKTGKAKDVYDYDVRGWWKETGGKMDERGHGTDKFKKPNHPTFSKESKYSKGTMKGGEWVKGSDDKWSFRASKWNTQAWNPKALNEYFRKVEPGVRLEIPTDAEKTIAGGR